MKILSAVLSIIFLAWVQGSSAMEIELEDLTKEILLINDDSGNKYRGDYGSMSTQRPVGKTKLSSVKLINEAKKYRRNILPSLKLSEVKEKFSSLSDYGKWQVKKSMSKSLWLLHCIAVQLPEDVIKNHILFYMFDGHEKAAELFYDEPIDKSFQLYQEIKISMKDGNKPIGPLYILPEVNRNFILSTINPWHHLAPVITASDQRKIDNLDNTIKEYLVGKNVMILPEGDKNPCCEPENIYFCLGLTLGIPPLLTGMLFGGAAIFGACTGAGGAAQCFYVPEFVYTTLITSSVAGVGFGGCMCFMCGCGTWNNIKEVTI